MKKDIEKTNKINVSIKNKKEQLYLGEASSITSKNDRGVFDILPYHVNFITLIYDFIVIDRDLPTEKRYEMDNGILYTISNKVEIYIGL
jgi:F0F1-type ATP synthase epsilon subunit